MCWKWSTWIVGDWEMVLYCQSSSVSLLVTTLAMCFYLEAHQHHDKFVSSCLVPDQFLSSYWYRSSKCWEEIQSAITVCSRRLLLNLLSCHRWGQKWSKYNVIILIDIDDITLLYNVMLYMLYVDTLFCYNWLWVINKNCHILFNLGQESKDLIWQEENNQIP